MEMKISIIFLVSYMIQTAVLSGTETDFEDVKKKNSKFLEVYRQLMFAGATLTDPFCLMRTPA